MSVNQLSSCLLDIPLVSIRTKIVKPDKVETFYIVIKCFFLVFTLKMVKGN